MSRVFSALTVQASAHLDRSGKVPPWHWKPRFGIGLGCYSEKTPGILDSNARHETPDTIVIGGRVFPVSCTTFASAADVRCSFDSVSAFVCCLVTGFGALVIDLLGLWYHQPNARSVSPSVDVKESNRGAFHIAPSPSLAHPPPVRRRHDMQCLMCNLLHIFDKIKAQNRCLLFRKPILYSSPTYQSLSTGTSNGSIHIPKAQY